MKTVIPVVTALAMSLALAPAYAQNRDDNIDGDAAAAALLLIGAAALAHHSDHHQNGKHYNTGHKVAGYEKGYNDGLHNHPYDDRHDSVAYSEGFAAGHKERQNRRAKHDALEHAPTLAIRGCIGEASARWGRNPRDIQPVKSRKLAADDFMVEVAAGHRHGKCEMSKNGQVYLFENGRI